MATVSEKGNGFVEELVSIEQADKAAKKVAAVAALRPTMKAAKAGAKSLAEGKLCQIYNSGGKMVLQFAASMLFFKPSIATGVRALMAAIEAVCEKQEA